MVSSNNLPHLMNIGVGPCPPTLIPALHIAEVAHAATLPFSSDCIVGGVGACGNVPCHGFKGFT